ncbi:uncharacterized protein RCC_05338 [Ramularia collo-cygni]|uniref:Uncharacterized protein n=1 Tax=Ramularia collo-cygni TaxID=112498 RepID=A0A2D3V478_9PEZI|nr:uncharacterized protein RCC_05338 [Ramularia collo-cygni]CZT19487.1 uncharacterized protein RCC_05338 [Ramularia collo-cygni]
MTKSPPRSSWGSDTMNVNPNNDIHDENVVTNSATSDNAHIVEFVPPRMATAKSLTADQLRAGLETLPQELFDSIGEYTFTAQPGTRSISTKSGRATHRAHLKLLQVDSATRNLYAQSYYGQGAIIRLMTDDNVSWLNSLSAGHAALLRDFVFVYHWQVRTLGSPYLGSFHKSGLTLRLGDHECHGAEVIRHLRSKWLLESWTTLDKRDVDQRFRAGLVKELDMGDVVV